jgi:hypothetical protein
MPADAGPAPYASARQLKLVVVPSCKAAAMWSPCCHLQPAVDWLAFASLTLLVHAMLIAACHLYHVLQHVHCDQAGIDHMVHAYVCSLSLSHHRHHVNPSNPGL